MGEMEMEREREREDKMRFDQRKEVKVGRER